MFSLSTCFRRENEAKGGEFFLEDDGWLATHGAPKGIHCIIIFENNV